MLWKLILYYRNAILVSFQQYRGKKADFTTVHCEGRKKGPVMQKRKRRRKKKPLNRLPPINLFPNPISLCRDWDWEVSYLLGISDWTTVGSGRSISTWVMLPTSILWYLSLAFTPFFFLSTPLPNKLGAPDILPNGKTSGDSVSSFLH